MTRKGEHLILDQAPGWKGGESFDGTYVNIKKPGHPFAGSDGYVRRSILVWEKANGRPFPEGKEPHHLNGIKTDDRPENIQPLTHAEHTSLHRHLQLDDTEVKRLYTNEHLTMQALATKFNVSIGTIWGRIHAKS